MLFQFNCEHCEAPTSYLVDATSVVICGSCRQAGEASLLTPEQIIDLDLPNADTIE